MAELRAQSPRLVEVHLVQLELIVSVEDLKRDPVVSGLPMLIAGPCALGMTEMVRPMLIACSGAW